MAGRGCGCAGGSCSCSVIGGSGVNVTGIGTAADPFVVVAEIDQLSGPIQFNDSSTIDFTVSGDGTPSDPLVVTASIVAQTALALPTYTTAGRPSAATVGAGKAIFNTTTNLPNFSDGTNWRNAAGTIV